MLADDAYRISRLRVRVQNSSHQLSSLVTYVFRYLVVTGQNFLVEFPRVWIFEREVASYHGEEDNAGGPYVHCESRVLFAGDHFGSGVAWASACGF